MTDQYQGKEVHHAFRLANSMSVVLKSQDDGKTWWLQIHEHGIDVDVSKLLAEAGFDLTRWGNPSADVGVQNISTQLREIARSVGELDRYTPTPARVRHYTEVLSRLVRELQEIRQ